jgi:hypothetical protein
MAMTQVYIRRVIANSQDCEMIRANVLSQTGDTLRVISEGSKTPVTVKASEVTPLQAGRQVLRQFPTSREALANRLY